MATRHERVVLTLEDNFTTSAAKAAAATALINRELKSLSGAAAGTHRPLRATADDVDKVSSASARGQRDLDRFSGRLTILRDLALTIGPALAPIGAVAVPAVAGLAAQLGAATAAGTVAIIAFQGVGDALEAVNEAALEPTEENLEKARVALAAISPEARRFVRELQDMRPALRELRDAGAAGLFPGLIDGLSELEGVLPNLDRLFFAVGNSVGELGVELGEALNSERGREFLEFMRTEIPPTLTMLGRSVGNIAAGLAAMWEAFTPLNRDFSEFILDAARGFDEWAQGLSATEGFQEFIDYVRTNGPRVGEALGAIGSALLDIVEAAAPLGGPVLIALEAVADVISTIADSPVGPTLLATATALSLLSRTQKTFGAVAQSSWGQAIRGAQGYEKKMATIRSTAARGAGVVGGLALAGASVGDNFALANTASLALTGTLAGPWGAAVGGAVGLLLDLNKSSEKFEVSSDALIDTLDEQTGAITRNTQAYVANEFEKAGVLEAAEELGLSLSDVTDAALGYPDAINRVTTAIADAKSELFDDEGRAIVGTVELGEFRDNMFLVEDAIGSSRSALTDAQGEFRRIGLATAEGTRGLERISDGLREAAARADNFRESAEDLNKVLEGRAGIRDYEQALDDFTASVRENGTSLDVTTEKGRANQAALDAIAQNALAVAENMRGTNRVEFLKQARRDLIDAAKSLGLNEEKARKLARQLGLLDEIKAEPTVDVNGIDTALSRARALELTMERISRGDYTVNTVFTSDGKYFKDGFATGGYTGNMSASAIAGVVHGREVVIPEWLVRRDAAHLRSRYGFLPGMQNVKGYRNGGYVDSRVYDQRSYSSVSSSSGGQSIDYQRLAVAMAALQPQGQLYGDVYMQPHNYQQFQRQMEQDRRSKAGGGI